ncbi:MAG: DUF819 family protein [Flavobacteriales bacterium]|nr:DUF819 family protein [Flavobacteriales bacterium]
MSAVLQVIVMLVFPALVIELSKRNRMAGMIGPVILCYALGLLAGNLPNSPVNVKVSQELGEGAIPVAISLMLLSTNFMSWLRYAKLAVFSFSLAVVSILTTSFVVTFFFFKHYGDRLEFWKLSGMMVGVYTGGTPNLSAIGTALNAGHETFIIMNACDLVLSSIYLLLLLTVAQRIALKFLPSFVRVEETDREETFHYQRYRQDSGKRTIAKYLAMAFVLSMVILALSIGFSMLVADGQVTGPNVILGVTTLSIAASFFKRVRYLPRTYEFGEYFLLIFCLGIGSMSNISDLLQSSPLMFFYVSCVLFGTISLHFFLSWIFRVDADTALITSVAGIFGPAFIGPVASVLKNKDIVVSGLTTGLVGYAIANYLGLGIANLFRLLFH